MLDSWLQPSHPNHPDATNSSPTVGHGLPTKNRHAKNQTT